MAKRAYKLQEFVAHERSVRCLRIGRQASHRLLFTGGEDRRVNVWRIGKSSPPTTLSGHSSSVECIAFDSAEYLVLAGASSGAVKLWSLEESKLLRNVTGHKSKCTAIDFHPFGELFVSSSVGKGLKIWDIRKQGCLQAYKGHINGTSTVKFSPDGRWVVSGGLDNIVKVWDLRAEKLLHEFNFHSGPIRSIDFHPSEFLLATGSADRTVKFWDLETFEMVDSTRVEAAGVRALSYHPDGKTLFCGYDDSLKVYSSEPVIRHDSIDMEWSTLGDLCIHEQRLIGCSYYHNSVGIWAADISLIKPYGTRSVPDDHGPVQLEPDILESDSLSAIGSHSVSPDVDIKEIKTIYVDYEKPMNTKNTADPTLSKLPLKKNSPDVTISSRPVRLLTSKPVIAPNIDFRKNSDVKAFGSLRRESFSSVGASTCLPAAPFHTRTAWPDNNYDVESSPLCDSRSLTIVYGSVLDGLVSDTSSRDSPEEKYPVSVEDKSKQLQDISPLMQAKGETFDDSFDCKRPTEKVINGVTVVRGRTRALVERFETREKAIISRDDQIIESKISSELQADRITSSAMVNEEPPQISGRDLSSTIDDSIIEDLMQSHDTLLSELNYRLDKLKTIRCFWKEGDFKGAINMLKDFPDYSVQADVIKVLADKIEIVNFELFCCLLPVLLNLLNSPTERHSKISLKMLLKLVAVWGETISSVASATPSVGVDHQEERHCWNQLQALKCSLLEIARRSSLLAKLGRELNLVLECHNIG